MPPRITSTLTASVFNLTSLLQTLPSASRQQVFTQCAACLFSTTAPLEAKRSKKRKVKKHLDPYRLAQAQQRKAANLARQRVLQQERLDSVGDPVRSQSTPFLDSLRPGASVEAIKGTYLNYFLKQDDVKKTLEYSKWLTEPQPDTTSVPDSANKHEQQLDQHARAHENASTALLAIAALENGSSKDRTRINVQRCIEEFGRHNTDDTLPPKLQSKQALEAATHDNSSSLKVPRVGKDTGSSEVQIAILTAKINVLAENLHKKDKSNKRALRMMVHKRQKMLAYLSRQDRGGPRFQNVVEKLGVNDAMWKGEISL